MERIQLESRKRIDSDDRMLVLMKSDKRCCHCGCFFDYKHKFTIEHVIPISKGGTNEMSNLVALCENCNKEKDDSIILPCEYLHYLKPEYKEELQDRQENYYDRVNWLTPKNFFKEDKMVLRLPYVLGGHKSKKFGRGVVVKYVLEKAVYSDLDDIAKSLKAYNRKMGITQSDADIKEILTEHFEHGVFYIVRNQAKDIIITIPLSMRYFTNKNGSKGVIPYINGIITRYQSKTHEYITDIALNELFLSLKDAPVKSASPEGFILCAMYRKDAFIKNILVPNAPYPAGSDNNSFVSYMVSFDLSDDKVKDSGTKQRDVSGEAQYTVALKKYMEKCGHVIEESVFDTGYKKDN